MAVSHRIEKLPVIFRRVAVEEIFEHVGDRRTAGMRSIDIVVIDAILGKARCQRLAVTSGCGRPKRATRFAKSAWFMRLFSEACG
jgi:hypothetical protein